MIILTNKIWKTICDVNRYWNWKIEYVSDKEHYGRLDFWTYPNDDKGDCEDYAIAKKRDLGSKKIPAYLATCRTEKGILHAVVLVDTDGGHFVWIIAKIKCGIIKKWMVTYGRNENG